MLWVRTWYALGKRLVRIWYAFSTHGTYLVRMVDRIWYAYGMYGTHMSWFAFVTYVTHGTHKMVHTWYAPGTRLDAFGMHLVCILYAFGTQMVRNLLIWYALYALSGTHTV